MDMLPDDDQMAIRSTAAEMLEGAFGAEYAHELANGRGGDDAATWSELAQMGWFGLALPEEAGGAGLSSVEEAMVFGEAGRSLAPVALLATVLAAHVAHLAGRRDVLDPLLAGERRAGLLLRDGDRTLALALPASGVLLSLHDDRVVLYDASDLEVGSPTALIDPATPAVGCSLLGPALVELGASDLVELQARAGLLVSAYLTGIAHRMLATAVTYAGQREAFGRPIGSFQAIKHRLATTAMDGEAADAQVAYASVSLAQDIGDVGCEVNAAKVLALKAALDACGATIQTHGALGVTWEFDGHLFLTRARLLEHVPSSPRVCLDSLVQATA